MRSTLRTAPGLGFYAALVLIFLYAPLVILGVYAFNGGDLVTVWEGASPRWFLTVLSDTGIRAAALHSLIIAAVATVVATSCAVLAALGLERLSLRRAERLAGIFSLPLVVPEIVTAVTTLAFFASIHLHLGLGNLIIAHITFCIPFAMMPIRARLRGMGDTLQHAAHDLYAPPLQVFTRITLPLLSPAILSGAILSFLVSLDDFVLSALLGGAGTTTLPVYIYGMIRRGITPEVNAISTLLLAVSLCLAIAGQALNRPWRRPTPAAAPEDPQNENSTGV